MAPPCRKENRLVKPYQGHSVFETSTKTVGLRPTIAACSGQRGVLVTDKGRYTIEYYIGVVRNPLSKYALSRSFQLM